MTVFLKDLFKSGKAHTLLFVDIYILSLLGSVFIFLSNNLLVEETESFVLWNLPFCILLEAQVYFSKSDLSLTVTNILN